MSLKAAMLRAAVLGALFLLAVWAFVSYLTPAFSGERAGMVLLCF